MRIKKIPIKKLNDKNGYHYPLSVGESTVITHDISVDHNIGNYKAGDIIPAVTTFDTIITTMLNGTGGSDVKIDNKTIVKNEDGDIQINIDNETLQYKDDKISVNLDDETLQYKDGKISANLEEYVKRKVDEKISGNYTFENTIKFDVSEIGEPKRIVEDPDPDGSFEIPSGLPELPETGNITNGTYIVSSDRSNGIIVTGDDVSIYVAEGVTVTGFTADGIWVKPGAVCRLYNKGTIQSMSRDTYCAVFNEGTLYIKGGSYHVGINDHPFNCIINHGVLMELWDLSITNDTFSDPIINGYFIYATTPTTRNGFNADGTDCKTPKMIIHSGNYKNNEISLIVKNDHGGSIIIYDGYFENTSWGAPLQNSGISCEIHGGTWINTFDNVIIYNGFGAEYGDQGNNGDLLITGGLFTTVNSYWLWDKNSEITKKTIKGGVFGPSFNYTKDGSDLYPLDNFIPKEYMGIRYKTNVYVHPSDYFQSLKGIRFTDGTGLSNTVLGTTINGIMDVEDPTSVVSKSYVDTHDVIIDKDTIITNSSGKIEVNEYYRPEMVTSFEVIACSAGKYVHDILPDDARYNKEPIYDLNCKEIHPSTRTIKGNGMTHNLVLRVSLTDDTDEVIKDSDTIIDWGDGTRDSVESICSSHYKKIDHDNWFVRNYNYGRLDSESILNVKFEHTYKEEGKYIVKVIGKRFFGMYTTAFIYAGNIKWTGKSLISKIFSDDLHIADNHTDFTDLCLNSPLLTEVQFSRRVEFPHIQVSTDLFRECSNLITVTGARDKFRSAYDQTWGFYKCTSLLLTDYRVNATSGHRASAGNLYNNCTKLGTKFFNIQNGTVIDPTKFLGQATYVSSSKIVIDGKEITTFKDGQVIYTLKTDTNVECTQRGYVYQYQSAQKNWIVVGVVCWNYVEDLLPYNGLCVSHKCDINSIFKNCSSITSNDYALLERMLWNNPITRYDNTTYVFNGCSSLDLDKIPIKWGGTGENVPSLIYVTSNEEVKTAVILLLERNGFDRSQIITE